MKHLQRSTIATAALAAFLTCWLTPSATAQAMLGAGNLGDTNSADEEPTTLPMVDGGLGQGGWWVEDDGSLGGALPIGPGSQPTLTFVGYAYALDRAILSSEGTGFGIVEVLPGGLERRSFHGHVELVVSASMLAGGSIEAEVHVPDSFHAAQAAVQAQGVWTPPFTLTGSDVLSVPNSALTPAHTSPVRLLALSPVGERYSVSIATQSNQLTLTQTLDF